MAAFILRQSYRGKCRRAVLENALPAVFIIDGLGNIQANCQFA